ncbi:hypothetical protein [Desulfosarcina widdelii]|jgi:hypothetical protein|uniref:hypothetical protein n=1 Tax=Desulfosarcina widdelii TaxID=947919 RepID=UPI0012D342A4|nr:hypothetical protein [Desulfosarcina widdelii]
MKRIKTSIIVIGVVSGCLILAVIGYAGMGGGNHGSTDRFDGRYGDNHGNGSYHDSNYNDHHWDYDNYQGYSRSNRHRNRPPYEHHNNEIMDHEMNIGNGIDRYPGNGILHRKGSVRERYNHTRID